MKSKKLPEMCYLFRPAGGPGRYIAIIRNGELGFFTTDIEDQDADAAQAIVDVMNKNLGVTPLIADCMLSGSMFGWDVDAADPDYVEHNNSMNHFDLVLDDENLFEA